MILWIWRFGISIDGLQLVRTSWEILKGKAYLVEMCLSEYNSEWVKIRNHSQDRLQTGRWHSMAVEFFRKLSKWNLSGQRGCVYQNWSKLSSICTTVHRLSLYILYTLTPPTLMFTVTLKPLHSFEIDIRIILLSDYPQYYCGRIRQTITFIVNLYFLKACHRPLHSIHIAE